MTDTVLTSDRVTFRTSPHTTHIVRRQVNLVDGAVEAWCGRKGIGYQPGPSAWRNCAACRDATSSSEGSDLQSRASATIPAVKDDAVG